MCYDERMKSPTPLKPTVVLCVAAHPDNLEATVAGSVAKWIQDGAEVHFLVCTGGDKGSPDRQVTSDDVAVTRRDEQHAAAQLLGVKSVTFLGYEDGQTEPSVGLKQDIAREIRRFKPDTVVTLDPHILYDAESGMVNHVDHRSIGTATIDAVYPLARDHLSFPELIAEGFEPHRVADLLLMREPLFTNFHNSANYFVDITSTFELKVKALAAHQSQTGNEWFSALLEQVATDAGRVAGVKKAEAFIRIHMSI